MCSYEDSKGGTKYIEKHLEQKQKIPFKKIGCPYNIVIKCYPDMKRILRHYKTEHNHPIRITNVPFIHLSARFQSIKLLRA